MGYNKDNYKRIREEYQTKCFRAEAEADARREELYAVIPTLRDLDRQMSSCGLRIMQAALRNGDTANEIAQMRVENQKIREARAALLRKNGYPADYCDPQYECEKCKDTGYVGIKMCSCMRQKLTEAGMEASGLSALMRQQSFSNFSLEYYSANPATYQKMQRNFEYLKRYAQGFTMRADTPAPQSLLFVGGTGLGKTHLSTAIAREVISRGYDVYYNSAVGLLSDFEHRRFGNGVAQASGESVERYTECDLLIIDDLGTEMINQFTVSCLYHVINTRLNLQKPMLINTNLKGSELQKAYGDRLASRLTGEFCVIPFLGEDIRKQKLMRGN